MSGGGGGGDVEIISGGGSGSAAAGGGSGRGKVLEVEILSSADGGGRGGARRGATEEVQIISGGGSSSSSSSSYSRGGGPTTLPCPFCNKHFTLLELPTHSPSCPQLPARFVGSSAPLSILRGASSTAPSLTSSQTAALAYVSAYARNASAAAMPALLKRCEALGHSAGTLEKTLLYIRDTSPLIVHFHPTMFPLFEKDTHYRSQFETGTSSGTLSRVTRVTWEGALFGNAYDSSPDFEKVKYGVLNTTGDNRGVVSAHCYGLCFLVLKEEVRARSTFANMDSGGVAGAGAGQGLSTCEHYAHVLLCFNDDELKRILVVGGGGSFSSFTGTAGSASATYKEAQIHGPLRFREDVSYCVVPESLKGTYKAQAMAFAEKHGISLLWV